MNMNLKLVNSNEETPKPEKPKSELSSKIKKYAIFVVIGVVAFLLVMFVLSLIVNPKRSYEQVEAIMKQAAEQYYSEHKNRLPGENTKNAGIEARTLIANEYMKDFSEYLGEDTKCDSGRVTVEKINDKFVYTPYLSCGKEYQTSELYAKVVDDKKIVASGDGLYNLNGEYVFRGTDVNNYIKLGNNMWRIVKVDSNNEMLLTRTDKEKTLSVVWDDRYNSTKGYNSGVNDFNVSRIRESLKLYYKSDSSLFYGEGKIFPKEVKEKLVPFDLCVGKRGVDYVVNNNSAECGQVIKNQMIGMLTMSDYLNASTDAECISPLSKSCQNYNYLIVDYNWWLITADASNTFNVYKVDRNGNITQTYASSMSYIRPTVKLSNRAMYKSGSGTEKDPYIIR